MITTAMNRDELKPLGFELGDHLGGQSEGAWSATTPDGVPAVLKWSADGAMIDRYAALLPGLDALRERGVPVPDYLHVIPFNGGTLSAQSILPGRSEDNPTQAVIDALVACIAAQAGIAGPPPAEGGAAGTAWGTFVVRILAEGADGWACHEPLRRWGPRSAALLDRIEAVGASADPARFPTNGLVHLDLHTDNVLIDDGALTGIIDWEGACAGDHRYDLVQFVFDLDGHDQPVWEIVDEASIEPQVLRAYVALLALKCTSSAIIERPHDVTRQLDRAERVFDRYAV